MEKTQLQRLLISALVVVFGNILYALTVKLFLLPAGLVTGGTTGIALAVYHGTGFEVSKFVLLFNVLMLVIGFLVLGKQFALTTIISTFTYPIALRVFDGLLGELVLTNDLFICTVFSGLGIGAALGLVLRAGASTGGMDIPPLVLHHYFKIPISVSLYVGDFIILLSQAYFQSLEKVFYGIVLVMIYTMVLDKLLLMGATRTELKIISKHPMAIRDAILNRIDRGVTLLSAQGGYLEENTPMIFSVVSNRELPRIERMIREIDPECFLVVSRVQEVRGRGFTLKKNYR